MPYTCYTFLYDFCFMSLLLFVAHLLRCNIKFFQNHYVPTSILAGVMGLAIGPQFTNIIPWSQQANSYPYLMTCVLFACIFLGRNSIISLKDIIRKTGDTFFINTGSEILCFGVALFIGGIFINLLFPNVFPEISLMLPAGFAGGHGYAAAIGGALNKLLDRTDAVYIGQTFATIGLLVGLFGGVACINYAANMGYTNFVKKASLLPLEYRTGLISKENRKEFGEITINSVSMDPWTFHIMLVLLATGIGFFIDKVLKIYFPSLEMPLMCLTMLAGILLQLLLNYLNYSQYIDKRIIDRTAGTLTDYLVSFGVATIKISVVAEFWQLIAILSVIGVIIPLIIVFVIGKKLFQTYWFERSIFIFGYLTGIVAVGITLLRSADPDMKSGTLEDFGLAYTLQSVIEVFLVAFIPLITVYFGCIETGLMLSIIGILFYIICYYMYKNKTEEV